jgi:hypothetical protein
MSSGDAELLRKPRRIDGDIADQNISHPMSTIS